MEATNDLLETWQINNRLNLYLLENIAEEQYASVSVTKGRSVAEQFAHIHNVRLMWLKAAAPELFSEQVKVEKDPKPTKDVLSSALLKSGEAINALLEQGIASGKIKGFKPHPTAFLGYLVAHESHHRAMIIQALKESGHPVDRKVLYGLWEWGSR